MRGTEVSENREYYGGKCWRHLKLRADRNKEGGKQKTQNLRKRKAYRQKKNALLLALKKFSALLISMASNLNTVKIKIFLNAYMLYVLSRYVSKQTAENY